MTEKIKLPKKIKVGGLEYDVRFPYKFNGNSGCLGIHNGETTTIRISSENNTSIILETLLHESLHALDHVYCGNSIEEDYIAVNARAWLQVLKDNDLYLDTGKIPKKVNINCFTYDVVYPYIFEEFEEGLAGQTANTDLELRLSRTSDGEIYNDRFTKVCLVYCIQSAITHLYFDLNKEVKSVETLKSKSFAHGWYQILFDNKLDKLVKKYRKVK